ncbi:hypothetical protein C4564_01925 [Candidatus Microgenomates bacterium]|nr:MAG: hypothetical protein C4564_01925 [Candidatus Microgenomates bacterium]
MLTFRGKSVRLKFNERGSLVKTLSFKHIIAVLWVLGLLGLWLMLSVGFISPDVSSGTEFEMEVGEHLYFTLDKDASIKVAPTCYPFTIGNGDGSRAIDAERVFVDSEIPIKCNYQYYYRLQSTSVQAGRWYMQNGYANVIFIADEAVTVTLSKDLFKAFVLSLFVLLAGSMFGKLTLRMILS